MTTSRATAAGTGAGSMKKFKTLSTAPIGPNQLGVVFNHSMQAEGYITGEIAFAVQDMRAIPSGFPASEYPGLSWLTAPNVFIVKARTPAEFMTVLGLLQGRSDLAWVEPTVLYGPTVPSMRKSATAAKRP
jgi:hypothetical protein